MKTSIDAGGLIAIFKGFTGALAHVRLYFPNHPQVLLQIEAVHDSLTQALARAGEITLVRIADEIIVGSTPVRTRDAVVEKFAEELARCGISRVTFERGLTLDELRDFVMDVAASGQSEVSSRTHLKVGLVKIPETAVGGAASSPEEAADSSMEAELFYDAKLIEIRKCYEGILGGESLDPMNLEGIVHAFSRVFKKGTNPLTLLSSLRAAHEYTYTHVANVFILTMSLAEAIGLSGRQLMDVGVASLLHDMGKLFVPDEILSKPGRLSEKEWGLMQSHTTRGAAYLLGVKGIPKVAILAALEHHIRFDKKGYPAMGEGYEPHLVSQMVTITDAFDAMRSRRAYQEAKSMDYILGVLEKDRGSAFDPVLVDAFIRMLEM